MIRIGSRVVVRRSGIITKHNIISTGLAIVTRTVA